MVRLRSSPLSTAVRILAIGVCAIPLAAGYADARSVAPSRPPVARLADSAWQGRQSPRAAFPSHDRNAPPPPPAQPATKVQPAPQSAPVGGPPPPDRSPAAGRSPRRDPGHGEGPPQDGRWHGQRSSGAGGSQQPVSPSNGDSSGAASAAGSAVAGGAGKAAAQDSGGAGNSRGGADSRAAGNGRGGGTRHRSRKPSGPSGGSSGGSSNGSSNGSSTGSSHNPAKTSPSSSNGAGSQGTSGSAATSAAPSAPPSAAPSAPATVATTVPPSQGTGAAAPTILNSSAQPPHGSSPAAHSGVRGARARRGASGGGGGAAGLPASAGTALAAFTQAASPSDRAPRPRSRPASQESSNPLAKLGGQIPLPIPVPDWSKPIIIALLLLALWFGVRSRLAAVRARRLERQRTLLLRDVGAMQAALVPEVPALLGGLAVSVAYRPAEGPAAGGDFYDVFAPEPGKVAMMLGDVAGHGHAALTHAALTRYTLRAYLQAGLEPRAALALAGRVLADPLGERYATVAVGVYDGSRNELTYALAGHPPPIMRGVQAREPLTVCSSPPVGWGAPTGRRQTTVSLPLGAAACFFSDGLIEARSDGELLGRERLREILAGLGSEPAASDVLEHVRAAAEGAPDDMVACVLAPEQALGEARIHVEELEADPQALCKDDVRRFLEECQVPASEIASTIDHARAIADSCGSALLRVELGADGSTVTATAPGGASPQSDSPGAEHSTGEPLLEALLAG